jgi:biopolymer transport protein ExbD
MAMTIGSGGEDESMVDINTTPLIDVMLVLLVVLIVSIPIMTHAVKLDMPVPNPNQPPTEPDIIEVEVDFDGTYLWNGLTVDDQTMVNYLNAAAQQNPQPELHLRPNRRVKYDYVARVLAAAQRQGVTKIGFVGNEQFMEN